MIWALLMCFLIDVLQAGGQKGVDGGLLPDANGLDGEPSGQKESDGKWQKPRISRKSLMKRCLVKWIIASTGPKEQGETEKWWKRK